MAPQLFVLAFAFLPWYTMALQVTPNSPCASFCVDSNDLDFSDPNSSNTENDDITCYDSKYTSSPAGQKFERCISCLQDSSFSQGSENDQLWFLYNLRYTFDYCIFGFPDAKDVASTPCSTETACGELQTALTDDRLKGTKLDYSYCSAGGGAMTGPAVEKCLACVAASDDQHFLANYIVALDTGCKQQPPVGTSVGLNDTVFSKTRIAAVDPATETSDDQAAMPMGTLVGIVVGAVAIVLVIGGIIFVRCRKRRNIRLRLEGNRSSGIGPLGRNGPASPLSFRCQTHVTPRSPSFPRTISETALEGEKGYAGAHAHYGPYSPSPVSPPLSPSSASSASVWRLHQYQNQNPSPETSAPSSYARRGGNADRGLHSIATGDPPTFPGHVHYPAAAGTASLPAATDDDVAPPSTVSTRSTSQLLPQLRPYNPAAYSAGSGLPSPTLSQQAAAAAAGVSSPESTYASPTSGSTASPLLSRTWDQRAPVWDVPPLQQQQQNQQRRSGRPSNLAGALGRATFAVAGGRGGRFSGNGNGNGSCSPVETTQINTVFSAPPTSPRR